MSEMRCPRCGNIVPPMTDRCPACGTPLSNGVLPQLQFVDAVKMVFQKYADFPDVRVGQSFGGSICLE